MLEVSARRRGAITRHEEETERRLLQTHSHIPCCTRASLVAHYSWGKGGAGQLGWGGGEDQPRPGRVEVDWVVMAVGGWEHSVFLTAEGAVFSVGSGYKDSRRGDAPNVLGREGSTAIGKVMDGCVWVASGWDHCGAVTNKGELYCWGSGSNGKLGGEGDAERPRKVDNIGKVEIFEAGCEHSVAVDEDGRVWAWGAVEGGRLGLEGRGIISTPTLVPGLEDQRVVGLAVGDKYNMVLCQPRVTAPEPIPEPMPFREVSEERAPTSVDVNFLAHC